MRFWVTSIIGNKLTQEQQWAKLRLGFEVAESLGLSALLSGRENPSRYCELASTTAQQAHRIRTISVPPSGLVCRLEPS
jgi:hypothetical protein